MNKRSFFVGMLAASILLCMYDFTGLVIHTIVAVTSAALLIINTLKTRDSWENPANEIVMRGCFVLAFLTGIVMMFIPGSEMLSLFHKGLSSLFVILLVLLDTKNAF